MHIGVGGDGDVGAIIHRQQCARRHREFFELGQQVQFGSGFQRAELRSPTEPLSRSCTMSTSGERSRDEIQ